MGAEGPADPAALLREVGYRCTEEPPRLQGCASPVPRLLPLQVPAVPGSPGEGAGTGRRRRTRGWGAWGGGWGRSQGVPRGTLPSAQQQALPAMRMCPSYLLPLVPLA